MTTDALIRELRTNADFKKGTAFANLLQLAADRLEELDERVAIMEEGNGYRDENGLKEYMPTQTNLLDL